MADETTIIETLTFKTQIHKAWDGTEQRAAIRTYPRRSVSYDYYGMKPEQSQYLRALLYNKQNEKIEFPLWHAATRMTDIAYINNSHIMINPTDMWPFRGCSGLSFWTNDDKGGDRYFLESLYADGTLKLSEILEKSYPLQPTIIYPVCYGYLQKEDKYSLYNASLMTMQINFELLDDFSLTGLPAALNENNFETWTYKTPYQAALPATYLGYNVFPLAPSWTDDLSASFERNVNELDNDSGLVKFDLKSSDTSETKEIQFNLTSRSEIHNFQRFFVRCRGRLKAFYAPTWLNDLTLAGSAAKGSSYFLVKWTLFWKYYADINRRNKAIVFFKNGTAKILNIAGYATADGGAYGKVYVETPLTVALTPATVQMISFFCLYRFDSDTLTTEYETTGIATVATSFAEVNA